MKFRTLTLTIFAFLFLAATISAQEVLLKEKQKISGFISIEPMVSNYGGQLVFNQNANAAVLLNNRFYIGGFSEAMLASRNGGIINNYDCFEPDFGAAGLMIGSIIKPERLIHLDLRGKIGLGALRIDESSPPVIIGEDFASDYEPVFVAHPSAGIEVNVTKFFKLNTHIGYRYVGYIDDPSYNKNDLNGLTGQIGIVFGWFGQKKKKEVREDESLMSL